MAHSQQLAFVRTVAGALAPDGYVGKKILEIGSYDVNGSVRDFFRGAQYKGVDLAPGPGVDEVAEGDRLQDAAGTYDLALSCECFEHNPRWRETLLNMWRMTREGGIVLISCATAGRLEHGTRRTEPQESPGSQSIGWDYYRNLRERDFVNHFHLEELFDQHLFLQNRRSRDLYFVGRKTGAALFSFSPEALRQQLKDALLQTYRFEQRALGWPRRIRRALDAATLTPLIPLEFLPDSVYQTIALVYTKADFACKSGVKRAILQAIQLFPR